LSQNHAPLEMKQILLQNLHNWLEPTRMINKLNETDTPYLTIAATQQSNIEWKHFIRGRLTSNGAI
jgi:hypothetical protein